ncbi:MAG: hypothetical protein EOM80_03890 [Erysipelotrichia bacterium]|nr:hypothetical protein [Erysipelotrichia bacterium]
MSLRIAVLLFVFSLLFSVVFASESTSDLLLSGNDIDLLVGTPTGVTEPLDPKRTVIAPQDKLDFSGFLEDDFQAEPGFATLEWSDAEDRPAGEDVTEEQLLDLLSETEEIEQSETDDAAEPSEANSDDYIETELEL